MATQPPAPRTSVVSPRRVSRRRIRVLLALGSPMECQLLLGAAQRSQQQLEVVACAISRSEVLRVLSRNKLDVAVLSRDLQDGPLTGLELLPELGATYPKIPVVMLFDAGQEALIVRAFRNGAAGVFCRSEKKLELLWRCIRAVHQGQVWANSAQLRLLLNTLRTVEPAQTARASAKTLAGREIQVAHLVAQGMQNKQIAAELGITEHTVSNYLFRIYNKLGISSRVELVLHVTRNPEFALPHPLDARRADFHRDAKRA